ncbi:hypothetical protein [Paenibacillus ginsengarvi]|uniref:Uncharacterized protein n=1 Tax=Paenibacillus ginsengarvi TaxID=400777 RepID=A0A3B0AJB3_9BACL|nr:hypothetical protein [Paenibacillus ginsengarvi]RKN60748.1 hypothetical protein D7M11_35810 [Paenibacillus ginsengarvi]
MAIKGQKFISYTEEEKKEAICLHLEERTIDYDSAQSALLSFTEKGLGHHTVSADDAVAAYVQLFHDFAESVLNDSPQQVFPAFSLRIFEACVGTLLSAKTGRLIELPLRESDEVVWNNRI